MKTAADARRKAAEHRIRPGDKVLRRRHNRRKTDTFFEVEPWTVADVTGNSLLMRRGEQACRRHVSDAKLWQSASHDEEEEEEDTIAGRSHPREAKKAVCYREPDGRKCE